MRINVASPFLLLLYCNLITKLFAGYSKNINYKYILIWLLPDYQSYFHKKYNINFVQANCRFKNCLFIHDRKYFKDFKDFDSIIFYGPKLQNNSYIFEANKNRSPKQMYIFATQESAHNYPLCYDEVQGFFNLTWTYRLDSNLPSPYILVKDTTGKTIGPKENMNWIKYEDMKDTPENMKNKLRMKHKAIAWLVSSCTAKSDRDDYVAEIDKISEIHVDIFGACGKQYYKCGITKQLLNDCWQIIEDNYYFYLSFENSFSKDYVTEKVLQPLKHHTVPIVFGTANYTRFMPDGIYLNAMQLSPADLISEIRNVINNKEKYFSFFKWHNHYSYHDPDEFPESNKLCELCYMLNDEKFIAEGNVYKNFRDWWNEPLECSSAR